MKTCRIILDIEKEDKPPFNSFRVKNVQILR